MSYFEGKNGRVGFVAQIYGESYLPKEEGRGERIMFDKHIHGDLTHHGHSSISTHGNYSYF